MKGIKSSVIEKKIKDLGVREVLRLWHLAGIPTNGVYYRLYKRLWQRLNRESKEVRAIEARQAQARRAKNPIPHREAQRRWAKKYPERARAAVRRYQKSIRRWSIARPEGNRTAKKRSSSKE